MVARLLILLLTIVHVGHGFLFGGLGGGGCDACGGGGYSGGQSYGSGYDQSYGQQQNYGQDYGQSYSPQTQTFIQQPRVTSGHYIIRSKVYQPYIRRTTVQLIPQQGQVVKPYRTEFVPDQVVSSGQSYGGSYQQPSYGSSYGSYSQDQSGGGQSYGGQYGQGAYGSFG